MLLSEVLLLLCLDQCLQKFINKTLQGGKRLLFNSAPWPPAEQKLEMPCDIDKGAPSPVPVSPVKNNGEQVKYSVDKGALSPVENNGEQVKYIVNTEPVSPGEKMENKETIMLKKRVLVPSLRQK